MLRDSVATESIYGFAPEQADVQPSEPIFVLTGSQLLGTIQSLKDEVSVLKDTVANQAKKIASLEATQDAQAENELNMLRLINDLRGNKETGPQTRDRVDILRALLAANDGKMLEKQARQKMHLSRSQFSKLLDHAREYVVVKPYHLRRNQKILVQVVSGNKKQD